MAGGSGVFRVEKNDLFNKLVLIVDKVSDGSGELLVGRGVLEVYDPRLGVTREAVQDGLLLHGGSKGEPVFRLKVAGEPNFLYRPWNRAAFDIDVNHVAVGQSKKGINGH